MDKLFFSGGADGADTYWSLLANHHGYQVVNYAFHGYLIPNIHIRKMGITTISDIDLEQAKYHVKEASLILGKNVPTGYVKKLIYRNYFIIKDAEIVYAVCSIKDGLPYGGTGWGCVMADHAGKKVNILDKDTLLWYDYADTNFTPIQSPTSPSDAICGIGSREIDKTHMIKMAEVFK